MSDPDPTAAAAPEATDYRGLFENAPCGLLSMSRDGTIREVNDALVVLSGRQREDLVAGSRFRDLLSAGGRIFYETHLAPLLDLQGFLREIALDVVQPDGTTVSTLVSAAVRPDTDLVQVVVLDATERRSYEHELLVSRGHIERLHTIASRFASALDLDSVAQVALDEVVGGSLAQGAALMAYAKPSRTEAPVMYVRTDPETLAAGWTSLDVATTAPLVEALQSTTPRFFDADDGPSLDLPPLVGPDQDPVRLAILPLVIEAKSIGLLCLASSTDRGFAADERTFLLTLARSCAQAVDRARLLQQAIDRERHLTFLSSISAALFNEPLVPTDRAQLIVDLLVPEHADFATIELSYAGSPPIAASHVVQDLVAPLRALRARIRDNQGTPRAATRVRPEGAPLLLSDVTEEILAEFALDDEEMRLVGTLEPRSFVALPLMARGREVGVMVLGHSQSGRQFTDDDLDFFVDLADRVALALENARLYEEQAGIAFRVQMSLLPEPLDPDPRVHLTALYRPATDALEIGGDWHDAFFVDSDRLGIAVGDVVGHDEAAALVMGRLSTALRAFALDGGGPALTLHRLSRFAHSINGAECATVAYAELDLNTRTLTYACAGHMPPILQVPGTPSEPLWSGRSAALGIDPTAAAEQASVPLPPGAAVLLFTDGLIEDRSRPFDDSLTDLVERLDRLPPLATADTAAAALEKLMADAPPGDDVCAVAVSLAKAAWSGSPDHV